MPDFFALHHDAYSLHPETREKTGFRDCQRGAIWAARSHFTVSDGHALISMPTGTGKTGVMIALAFEFSARRVFVLAPTQLIRKQTADKFESLDLLKRIGALPSSFKHKPNVVQLTSRPKPSDWSALLKYDVVVATPHTISPEYGVHPPEGFFGTDDDSKSPNRPAFDLIFIDEAHHSAAKTWNAFLRLARRTKVVCMTATPFRADRRRIRSRLIYHYPISKALEAGIYRGVRFVPIDESHPHRRDVLLAETALTLFKGEERHDKGISVIVKAKNIKHAESLLSTYAAVGWKDLGIIHSELGFKENQEVIEKVRAKGHEGTPAEERLSGFISVDMAGEGIDIPNLRIAVFHDAPKTLPYTIQLIGRVSRLEKRERGRGAEAILVADKREGKGGELDELYRSDKGWSLMLPKLFEDKLRQTKLEDDPGRTLSLPWLSDDDFRPYLSVKVYEDREKPFSRKRFLSAPENPNVAGDEIIIEAFERRQDLVYVLTRTWQVPPWTTVRMLETERFDLHVFVSVGPWLFECTSMERVCKRLRPFVFNYDDERYQPVRYYTIRKVLSDASGGHYHMVGLSNSLGATSGLPQYKTYLGEDVQTALRIADGRAFSAGHAVMTKDGVTRGLAIRSSQVWSNHRGPLAELESWCRQLAALLSAPESTPIPHIEDKVPPPEPITSYPVDLEPIAVILRDALLHLHEVRFIIDGEPIDQPVCSFVDVKLNRPKNELGATLKLHDAATNTFREVPLKHQLSHPFWRSDARQAVEVRLDPKPDEADVVGDLNEFLTQFAPVIVFDSGATLIEDLLFTPPIQKQRLDPDLIVAKVWADTDLKREALPPRKGYRFNVMERTIELIASQLHLAASDLLICDDRAHEVADLVLIRSAEQSVTFFHLKFKVSKGETPGFAREDVSELIDQGVRTGHWIRAPRLMQRLADRLGKGSSIKKGKDSQLRKLATTFYPDHWAYHVVIVQPGLSRQAIVDASKPTQTEQLLMMLRDRLTADYGATFRVWTGD